MADLPVSNTQYVCDNRIASTALYECFKAGSSNTKWSIFIWVELLKIIYNSTVL